MRTSFLLRIFLSELLAPGNLVSFISGERFRAMGLLWFRHQSLRLLSFVGVRVGVPLKGETAVSFGERS